jgi:hypothetical protein
MPPVTPQQGSRAGLISGLIASIIIGLVFAVFYFQERGLRQKAENDVKATEARYVGYIPEGEPSEALKAMKEASNTAGGSEEGRKPTLAPLATNAFDMAFGERQALIKLNTGSSSASAKDASDFVVASLKEAGDRVKAAAVKPEGVNFTLPPAVVVKQLADAWVKLSADKVAADKSAADAQAQVAAANKTKDEALATSNAEIKKVQDQLATTQKNVEALQTQNATSLADVTKASAGSMETFTQQIAERDTQIAKLTPQIPALTKELDVAKRALKSFRMDPSDNLVRRPDGVITRISEDRRTCYIDLGEGDRIVPGMTFEVYDASKGIPSLKQDIAGFEDEEAKRSRAASAKLNASTGLSANSRGERYDTQLPEGGKGSIEVISVGPGHTSTCRIIKSIAQAGIRAGDQIANLVYDKNVRFKFVVFGQYDLDYNGITTLSDTATIKRLVEQWGGKVTAANTADDITPDVDFIVMGIAPVVPTLSAEDANNPGAQAAVAKAKADKDAYDNVLQRAREFSIPVLNQTRFLYYTGYFDQRIR